MNYIENLCEIVTEECAEVIQAMSKVKRFGLDNFHPNDPEKLNVDLLLEEYYQMQAAMELLLSNNFFLDLEPDIIQKIKEKKNKNIFKFEKISKLIGTIEEDFILCSFRYPKDGIDKDFIVLCDDQMMYEMQLTENGWFCYKTNKIQENVVAWKEKKSNFMSKQCDPIYLKNHSDNYWNNIFEDNDL